MTVQDYAILMTEKAAEQLLRNAKAMPADKLAWKPAETSRTALDQIQECAQSGSWFSSILEKRAFPEFNEEEYAKAVAERQSWDTIEKCEAVMKEYNTKLYAAIRDIRDEELGVSMDFPWAPGMRFTIVEMLLSQYWNLIYHVGQLSYIQTMYGDNEMH